MSDTENTTTETQDALFTVTREFAAPCEKLFEVWTDVEHLKKWWGPKGYQVKSAKLDLQPGGLFHYCLQPPEGEEIWGRIAFSKIVSPEELVYLFSFSDEVGGKVRHPAAPNWPVELLTTVSFEEFGEGTRLSVTAEPLNATETENQAFSSAHEQMLRGWVGTFDQLEAYLETLAEAD